jgi:hypothetical protein
MIGRPSNGVEQFWAKVQKSDGCWLWTGTKQDSGYGSFSSKHKIVSAHRYVWQITLGRIPKGLCVCHKCDVRLRVRPDHLFLGTLVENTADRHRKGRSACGERMPAAKLSADKVAEIRRTFYGTPLSVEEFAACRNVSVTTLRYALKGLTWKQVKEPSPSKQRKSRTPSSGKDHVFANAKLDWKTIKKIKAEYASGAFSQAYLARKHGVARTSICDLVNGRTWVEA